jgi:hypothetical protein
MPGAQCTRSLACGLHKEIRGDHGASREPKVTRVGRNSIHSESAAPRAGCLELVYAFAFGRYLRTMTCSALLDLDGTLIDSHPGILASCLAALRALGHEPDETLDIRRTIGPPLEDMMQILLQSYGDDRVGEAVAAYRQHYGESGLLGSVPYPGIGESLEEMKRTELRLYLATSKRAILHAAFWTI